MQAVAAGQVLMTIADSGPMAGPMKAASCGRWRSPPTKRPPAFPDVPTLAEAGIADMEIALWTGIVAPAGTPAEIVGACRTRSPTRSRCRRCATALDAIDVDPRSTTPDEYRALIARDTARWKAVAAKANIKLE